MRRGFLVGVGATLVGIALVVLVPLLLFARHAGPPRTGVTLPGDIPATFYHPYGSYGQGPGVVMGHGYSGDRTTMSSLARSLARAGYGVLTIDFRGHGANPNGYGERDPADDVVAALDWLSRSSEIDGNSLALVGHSMGGHAVLDVARRDDRVDATVVLGASGSFAGAENVLFLYGEHESAPAGAELIDGANHITILWFDDTVATTVAWLDDTFDVERSYTPAIEDSRLAVAGTYFVVAVLALPLLGLIAGRPVRRSPGDAPPSIRGLALGAAVAVAGAFVLFVPLDGVVKRLVPTRERLLLAALMAPLLALFFVPLQALLRRGPLWRATAASVAGHAAVLLALAAGVVLDLVPDVVALALPLVAGVFGLVEAFAIGAYARTRTGAFIGLVEALWVAGIAAVAMPLPG